ncbi:MAG TPA: hypothetical protein VGB56_12945 [Flavisolibacter sp.]|jgi:hypothetical protein
MKFLSLEPFVPSGSDFEKAKEFFRELGFSVTWDGGDYVGFQKDGSRFILQNYNNTAFAENLMLNVAISSAQDFWQFVHDKNLVDKFGIRLGMPTRQPYGLEVNIIDAAGVCWHFVE